jgi:RNA polymerase sigma-70 factor (ECF subfamily)
VPDAVDEVDFGTLYERHADDVLRFALYLAGERAEAEDIAAETFARAWVAREEIRVGTVKAYLLMIARNLYRSSKRRGLRPSVVDEHVPDPGAAPEAGAHARGELERVLAAVQRLPELDRAALLMRAQGELSYEAIAAALDLSVAATRVKVHRARLKLSELVPEEGKKTHEHHA